MTPAEILLGVAWLGLTAYALFAGADFGAGLWDLFAGGARRGSAQRTLIEHVIGPVWEANHVWLIFVIVVLWTAFPPAFSAAFSTLYLPLTGAALGIILRGSGFAFRKVVGGGGASAPHPGGGANHELALKRLFGAAFAASSVLTPFFLGTVAGAVASGRVPPGNAAGDVITSWLNPTSLLGGVLAVLSCAYLAAVYLTRDAQREGDEQLVAAFRVRGLATGVAVGAVALAGIGVLSLDAPALSAGLLGRALPLIVASALGGVGSLGLLWAGRFRAARVAAAVAVTAVLWGWAAGQYPFMLPDELTIAEAAANEAVIEAVLISLAIGAALVVPSLAWLYVLFQRSEQPA